MYYSDAHPANKTLHRLLAFLIACFVCVGSLAVGTEEVDAKTVKLSNKSVTLVMGGSKKIELSDGSGKWSIKNNGVAALKNKKKKSVTVVPKKAGSTVLTCKVGKKKLKCKVKVLNNSVGSLSDLGRAVKQGKSVSYEINIPEEVGDVTLETLSYNAKRAKVTIKEPGPRQYVVKVKVLKPGRIKLHHRFSDGRQEDIFINGYDGFRGKSKAKKTDKNYNKWRSSWLKRCVSKDMSTWEIIDMIGALISTGKYNIKGEVSSRQLWYAGTGTCVSGAQMMNDFLKDMGLNSRIHFAGKDAPREDFQGMLTFYGTQHKNVRLKLKGKKYTLNPQPGYPWPFGLITRW